MIRRFAWVIKTAIPTFTINSRFSLTPILSHFTQTTFWLCFNQKTNWRFISRQNIFFLYDSGWKQIFTRTFLKISRKINDDTYACDDKIMRAGEISRRSLGLFLNPSKLLLISPLVSLNHIISFPFFSSLFPQKSFYFLSLSNFAVTFISIDFFLKFFFSVNILIFVFNNSLFFWLSLMSLDFKITIYPQ